MTRETPEQIARALLEVLGAERSRALATLPAGKVLLIMHELERLARRALRTRDRP